MRVYLVAKYRKKEDNYIILFAFKDKAKAKSKVMELDNQVKYDKRKKIWHNIEKFDITDMEDNIEIRKDG